MADCCAQTAGNNPFEVFAEKQSPLFEKAYQQKDPATYKQLLDDFMKKYELLDSTEQKNYSGYLQNALYNLCCTYSLLNNKTLALQYLKKAIAAGYANYSHAQADKDLDNIRHETTFKKMLEPLRAIGDYRYILERAGQYGITDKKPIPVFTYQSAANPSLVALRKGFNLDSIAGEGSDVLQMINLMHWIHTLIPHDGNHPNPQVKNAISMIEVCKKDKRGLNCRGLATVLNECYLAMGFKSRFVTCLPKDSLQVDPDCHVINSVFSNSLKKWLWMDPTNDAYVMNEKGALLGIAEVRERIIHHQPLILNPAANWNNKVSKTKDEYLYYYMAKNLYMLQCEVNSEYNAETSENGKAFTYITLLPVTHFRQTRLEEKRDEKNNSVYRYYQTNNPVYFWQHP
jgi:hypothetical protein